MIAKLVNVVSVGSVKFPIGKEILVDVKEGVGYVDGFHFDLSESEYKLIVFS